MDSSSDDSEDSRCSTIPETTEDHIIELSPSATRDKYREVSNPSVSASKFRLTSVTKALKHQQILIGDLQRQLKEMRLQNGSLAVDLSKKRRSSKTMVPVPEEFVKHIPKIELLGRKFWVMGEPWVDQDCFGVPCPIDITPISPQRYATDLSTKQGVIAELYAFVPEKFHKMMEEAPVFQERVCSTSINGKII